MVLVEIVTAVPLPYEVTPNLKGVWKWNLKGLSYPPGTENLFEGKLGTLEGNHYTERPIS